MKVYYDESPAGAGKTKRAIILITESKCKVLFITERIESFHELAARMAGEAARQGTNPLIESVYSGGNGRLGSVTRQIEALPDRHQMREHVIVIATHAAMLRSNFSDFAGWEIVVDEVPQFLDFEQKCTHLDSQFFTQFYDLHELKDGWSLVTATPAGQAASPSDLRADESHSHLAVFHGRVLAATVSDSKRHVLCNLTEWKLMENRGVQWCWASAFSLWELSAFDKVTLLGNRFRADIGSVISDTLTVEPIEWIELPKLVAMVNFHSRRVHINYFSDKRTASRRLFEGETGKSMLKEIGSKLSAELLGYEHIWSANDPEEHEATPRSSLEAGGMFTTNYISPRQAGTNRYRTLSYAAIIYSAKACPNLVSLLKVLNIDRSAWERSVEHEAILQFATRTSVREAGNSSPVHIWVFDIEQALYLKEYFEGLPYVTATMAHVENAPKVKACGKRGPKFKFFTPEEQVANELDKKARDAARKRRERAEAKRKKAA